MTRKNRVVAENSPMNSIEESGRCGIDNEYVLFNFKYSCKSDNDGKVLHILKLTLTNGHDEKNTDNFETRNYTIIDSLALICNEINYSDKIFNYNNYIKYQLNYRILLILLDYALAEQQKHGTIKTRHQLSPIHRFIKYYR